MVSIRRSLLAFTLLASLASPGALAQDGDYDLSFTARQPVANVGDGLVADILVTRGTEPVPNAEVRIGESRVTTNATGRAAYGLYNGADLGSRTFTASLERVTLANGDVVRPDAPNQTLTIAWTRLQLSITAPAATTRPGDTATLTAHVRWQHNQTPGQGVRVTVLLHDGAAANVTDASGVTLFGIVRATAGEVWANATIAPPDRPWSIRALAPPPVRVLFRNATPSPAATPAAPQGGPTPPAAPAPARTEESAPAHDGDARLPPVGFDARLDATRPGSTPWPSVAALIAVAAFIAGKRRP